MKTSVLDFIDSKTLRQHLSGQTLAPAVECILIAQSRSRSFNDKLAALQERYEHYSTEDFKRGAYNSFAEDFKWALKEYIEFKQGLLENINDASFYGEHYRVFTIEADDYEINGTICFELNRAIAIAKMLEGEDCKIIMREFNYVDTEPFTIELNSHKEIIDIFISKYVDAEYNVQNAYAEIPHKYEIGDIVKSGDNYAVVADVKHYKVLPDYMKHSDDTDMCLYCLGYYKDQLHSCKGAFGHLHFLILKTELCPEEELPESKKELIVLSRLLKGEIRIADFLEMYSNGDIDSLMKIKGLIK
ncbi:hypothetical protein SAMN02910353_02532 [Ruminococcus sp. YRD2003]|uniref:hypothetical protein n=1 Tax=Ruminococcus sp. YRD2003 TaxID=1452313 RepID=UPI0008C591B2|nr:hypothetical protein SAMN02910353_02532 [Ruminococcus flavefaciens]